jgi:hypothetical protein
MQATAFEVLRRHAERTPGARFGPEDVVAVRSGRGEDPDVRRLPPRRPHAWECDSSGWRCGQCGGENRTGVQRLRCFLCGLCNTCGRGPPDPPGSATTPMRATPFRRLGSDSSGATATTPQAPPTHDASPGAGAHPMSTRGGGGGSGSDRDAAGADEARAALDAAQRAAHPEQCTHALADVDVDFRPLLTALDASNVIRLVNALVCNYSVICVSDDLELLPTLITAAIALMHPLDWSPNVCIHVRRAHARARACNAAWGCP